MINYPNITGHQSNFSVGTNPFRSSNKNAWGNEFRVLHVLLADNLLCFYWTIVY